MLEVPEGQRPQQRAEDQLAAARQLGTGTLADPLASIAGLRDAVLGLGLPAVSPFGTAKDWLGFTSLHGAYGLFEHEAVLAKLAPLIKE